MSTKHALYATAIDRNGERQTFRVGQPADLNTISARHLRLDDRHYNSGRAHIITANRRQYIVEGAGKQTRAWTGLEVRAVDRHGRGLGSERHALAFPVPYRACRVAR